MTQTQKKLEFILQELVSLAKEKDIDVRIEKLVREVGYHARSGRCKLGQREVIILDKETPIGDKVEFLAQELNQEELDHASLSSELRALLGKA